MEEGLDHTAQTTKNHIARGTACVLVGGTCWGFSGMCCQLLTDSYGVPPILITWMRMLFSGLLLTLIAFVREPEKMKRMVHSPKTLLQILILSVFGAFAIQLPYISSIEYNGAGIATVLQSFGIVILIVATCIIHRTLPDKMDVVATVMALIGVFLIATKGKFTLEMSAVGLMWGMINASGQAFFSGYPKKLLRDWGSVPVMALTLLMGGIYSFPLARPWQSYGIQWDMLSILALIAVVFLGTFVAFTLFLQGVDDVGGVRANLLGLSEPVSATIFAWWFLGSALGPADLVGFALMIGMVIVVTLHDAKEAKKHSGDIPIKA